MPNHLTTAEDNAPWQQVTDTILFHVFSFLPAEALVKAAQVCHHWHQVALDEFIWKDLTYATWKIKRHTPLAPGAWSWREEFKRLHYHTPEVEDGILHEHRDQVLHVSFSHDGSLFATCSKDGFVKVWSSSYPVQLKYYDDMKAFTWKYTQYSQFNKTDTLLLVSGVHFGSQSTSGEIAVFNLVDGFELQCRVLNKPYDIFGTWYNERHLLSGNLHWLGNLASCSVLWLNKADQALESEREAVVRRLYKFRNINASSMRTIMIADNVEWMNHRANASGSSSSSSSSSHSSSDDLEAGPSTSQPRLTELQTVAPYCECDRSSSSEGANKVEASSVGGAGASSCQSQPVMSIVTKTGQKHKVNVAGKVKSLLSSNKGKSSHSNRNQEPNPTLDSCETDDVGGGYSTRCLKCGKEIYPAALQKSLGSEAGSRDTTPHSPRKHARRKLDTLERSDSLADESDKYLIFTMGTKTYTPHQIGIKKIDAQQVANVMRADMAYHHPNLPPPGPVPDVVLEPEEEEADEDFDQADHVVELNGHIIGMCLSPDHRHLYVNSRAWPPDYHIEDALHPPPIAQEIDIHVIDLATMQKVGVTHQSHRAYTPNDECFFIFLDVSSQYVASGAEDKHGYLWDRHYNMCLARFQHLDVVNCVAFNPTDPEMLVTVSDDHTVKIWRSKNCLKERQERAATSVTRDLSSVMRDLSPSQSQSAPL